MRERRKITNLVLALAAVGLGFFAQSRFRTDAIRDALILYLVAAVLLVYANRGRSSKLKAQSSKSEAEIPTRQLGWGPSAVSEATLRAGLALLALAGVCIILSLRLFGRGAPPTTAWLLYLVSIALFVAAFWAMEFTPKQWDLRQLLSFDRVKILSRLWPPKTETVVLIAILIVAAVVRLYNLDSLPFGVWYDEAVNGLEAQRILDDPLYRPIYMRPTNSPSHFMFLISFLFKLFGAGIVPVRVVSAIFGVAVVIAAYLFGREFFHDRRLALVLAFLMAISRWGVNFSRIGMYGITAPFFEFLTLYFLMKGLRSGRSLDFAIGGVAMGLGACFYSAFYLFAPVVGLFLIHKAIVERGFVRRHHLGILIFILAALLVFAPVGQFAWRNPQAFSDRTRVTSIFKDRTRAEAIEVVRQSAKQHLLMFNYRGDPNGRHNLPGQPMLDFVTSALLVLGLGYSLYRGLQPKYLLLVAWLLVMLCGGILSLEFEAPQSLRAIGSLPAAYVLACVPLYLIATEWDKVVRRWYWLLAAVCCLLLAYVGWKNMHTYFQVQARDFAVWNAFSTAETLTARRMAEMGPDYDFHVISLYHNHPVLRFLASNVAQYNRLETNATMPLRESGEREAVLFFDPERRPLFLEARRYYPGGIFEEFQSPYGGPAVLYSCQLTPGQIKDIQGLVGRYYQGSEWEGDPALESKDAQISFDWEAESPLPAPFSARWEGILYVPRYGYYNLGLMAPAEGRVHLDENLLLDEPGEAKLLLAKGNHALRVEAEGGDGRVDLYWQPPGEPSNPIPQQFLYTAPPVTNNGLLGRYYRGLDWAGEPALEQIDPSLAIYFHVTLLGRPYTVEWTGKLEAPTAGTYGFGLESIDDSWLYIDGQPVVEAHVPNQYREGQASLTAGWHDITVRFVDKSNHSHINLYWSPPGSGQEIIPSERLLPPQGAYPDLVVHAPTAPPVPMEPQEMTLGQPVIWGGPGADEGLFNEPRDIAVDKEGNVYVADTGNRRIQKFDGQGQFLLAWSGGEENFVEPLAVVVTSQHQVLVLDSDMGWIYRFTADGESLGRFGGPEAQLFHPRGMAIDAQDNIYIADTGGCRIIKYDVQGNQLTQFGDKGSGPGQLLEPTDVAIGPGGGLYVADTANLRIQRWDLFGRYQAEWGIALASAYNGPHLALAADGSLFATSPEEHQVRRYSPEGELLDQWGGLGQFRIPVGLTLDEAGNLYVADTLNHRVQKLETNGR
ncbi:MAG: glycosyltransferase family 39 protein [Anaerolineales bacterium]|nr:glycosyltransferase family 39 protein [Anaerolineales bacterium]